MVAGEGMAAGGADLAVVINPNGCIRIHPRTTLRDASLLARLKVGDEVRVEGAGTLGQHGKEISMDERLAWLKAARQVPEASTRWLVSLRRPIELPRETVRHATGPTTIDKPPKEELNGKQGKCGLDWFTKGRQGNDFYSDGRFEQRQLFICHAV
jgi:hypothetical protein